MKYADMVREARKNNSLESITSTFKKDWKSGERLTGRLMSVSLVENERLKSKYFSYLFNTDEGNIKTALGAGVDREVKPFMKLGQVFIVTSKGTIDTGKGKPMKVFDVVRVGGPDEGEELQAESKETEEELPF